MLIPDTFFLVFRVVAGVHVGRLKTLKLNAKQIC